MRNVSRQQEEAAAHSEGIHGEAMSVEDDIFLTAPEEGTSKPPRLRLNLTPLKAQHILRQHIACRWLLIRRDKRCIHRKGGLKNIHHIINLIRFNNIHNLHRCRINLNWSKLPYRSIIQITGVVVFLCTLPKVLLCPVLNRPSPKGTNLAIA